MKSRPISLRPSVDEYRCDIAVSPRGVCLLPCCHFPGIKYICIHVLLHCYVYSGSPLDWLCIHDLDVVQSSIGLSAVFVQNAAITPNTHIEDFNLI